MKKLNCLIVLSVIIFSATQFVFAHGGLDEMSTSQIKKFQQKMIAENS